MELVQVLTIIFGIATVVLALINYYTSIKKKLQLSIIEEINVAEDMNVSGAEKKAYVVDTVYDLVPTVWKGFIKKPFIEELVQLMFDKINSFAEKQIKQ